MLHHHVVSLAKDMEPSGEEFGPGGTPVFALLLFHSRELLERVFSLRSLRASALLFCESLRLRSLASLLSRAAFCEFFFSFSLLFGCARCERLRAIPLLLLGACSLRAGARLLLMGALLRCGASELLELLLALIALGAALVGFSLLVGEDLSPDGGGSRALFCQLRSKSRLCLRLFLGDRFPFFAFLGLDLGLFLSLFVQE